MSRPADSFDVTIEPRLDEGAEYSVGAAVDATRRARAAAEEASRLQREAATTLLTKNRLTVRDTGVLLRVCPQRVSQLAKKTAATSPGAAKPARQRQAG